MHYFKKTADGLEIAVNSVINFFSGLDGSTNGTGDANGKEGGVTIVGDTSKKGIMEKQDVADGASDITPVDGEALEAIAAVYGPQLDGIAEATAKAADMIGIVADNIDTNGSDKNYEYRNYSW